MVRRAWQMIVLGCAVLLGSTWSLASEGPALVVVVSIDQFPFEYLQRMRPQFHADGLFEKFWTDAALYTNCHHGHAFTYTAPGHSVLLTGAFPRQTGIIDNAWYDREQGKKRYCVIDKDEQVVGGGGDPASPRTLLVSTLGDMLKLHNPRSKVFGVALKDRASVLMAGHTADAAYWYDEESGQWVTSTYYRRDLPGYLRLYNESDAVEKFGGRNWELVYPRENYVEYYPDDALFETNYPPLGRAFPHPLPAAGDKKLFDAVTRTPYGNEITLDVARLIVEYEKLGQRETPDLLAINLSSNDYVGHGYGPHSLEVQDITYRTDQQLGQFMRFLREHLKGRGVLLVLSSDHGVAPVPEYAKQRGLPAGRNPFGKSTGFFGIQLEQALSERFGVSDVSYVQNFDYGEVYLRRDHPKLQGDALVEAQRIVRDRLLAEPFIGGAVTREAMLGTPPSDGLALQFYRTFNPLRSGDVLYCLAPYQISGTAPATHGSPWRYDSHIPLVFYGDGIKAGRYEQRVVPGAMAPTIARIWGIAPPPATAVEPLLEALRGE